jgi:lipopolysaccharide/colanic/teichoic acid biosynthesis glycosyltransferase
MNRRDCQQGVKRSLDVVASGSLLLFFCPLLAVVWLLVRWKMGRPAIFRQQRPGQFSRPFVLYKFRTMNNARDAKGALLPDAERLTPLGRFLRRTSLDELPQLWNVLRGQMSLVGPRPLLTAYVDRYSAEQARRLLVTPGITGWAQIHGRNAITWDEKLALDVWYVDHWNLRLDLAILLQTAVKVFQRKGISAEGHCTMPEFMGAHSSRKDAA